MTSHFNRRSGKPRLPQQQRDPGNRVCESTSARGKIRGTPRQLVERYLQFAEEARLANDRVASEAFLQSAEHYIRIGNPAPATENDLLPDTVPARGPVATAKPCSARATPGNVLVPPASMVPSPEPEPIIVKGSSRSQNAEKRARAEMASRRASAAAELERVALKHGYTLAQLGLALRSE